MRNPRDIRSQVVLRTDLRNMLDAISRAHLGLLGRMNTPETLAYADGFRAAIEAIAAAYDLDVEDWESTYPAAVRITYETDSRRLVSIAGNGDHAD